MQVLQITKELTIKEVPRDKPTKPTENLSRVKRQVTSLQL